MKMKSMLVTAVLLAAMPAMAQAPTATPSAPARTQNPSSGAGRGPASSPASSSANAPGSAPAVDSEKAAAVRQLMEVTGSAKIGDEIMNLLMDQVRTGMSRTITQDQRLQEFMATFTKEFETRVSAQKIEDAVIPIYAEHLSLDDIQSLTRFYQTPAGQHVIQALPQIVQQSQTVGAQIGQKAALDTLRGMTTQYPELKQILPPDDSGAPAGAGGPPPGPSPGAPSAAPGAAPAPRATPAPAPKSAPAPQP